MEKIAPISPVSRFRQYLTLTKPGIIFGNNMNAAAGFALASRGEFDFLLFLFTLTGLSLIVGAGCVFNNYLDRHIDQRMIRTKQRLTALGQVSIKEALIFGLTLTLLGMTLLLLFTPPVAPILALAGLLMYVCVYSPLKTRTDHCTLIGSVAGSIPPVVGYAAVTGKIDLAALLLFATVVFWQMPHFFAIAIRRLEDYRAASIPVLPVKRGVLSAKLQTLIYTIGFFLTAPLLTVFGYAGMFYFCVTLLLGGGWLVLAIKGFTASDDQKWAKHMFLFSLVVIMVLCTMIVLMHN